MGERTKSVERLAMADFYAAATIPTIVAVILGNVR
jgi:hypothetical protein